MTYPGESFERIADRMDGNTQITETRIMDWPALVKWHEDALARSNGTFKSCPHWEPYGQAGYIPLDSIRPKLREMILCGSCFTLAVQEMNDVGIDGDYTCNMCGVAPDPPKFADLIVALHYNVLLVGQVCTTCKSSQVVREKKE